MSHDVKISAKGVTKVFGPAQRPVEALCAVTLDIHKHEFVILVGPSGCGKSTLLNVLAGLEPATTGETTMDGRAVVGPGPDRTVVFQDHGLFPWLNVQQNVEFGMREQGVPAADRQARAQKWLAAVGLASAAKSRIHELSGGMRQRVAIARALALEPEVLLMDEPFSALDAQTRETLYVELQQIWRSTHSTIVFVTHNVREAVTLGDRVIVFRRPVPGLPSILSEVAVDIPRPRHIDDIEVTQVAREISARLRQEDTQ